MKNLALLCLIALCCSCGPEASTDNIAEANEPSEGKEKKVGFLIQPGAGFGEFTEEQSREDLLKALGKNNAVDRAFDLGEGEVAPGLILYPDTKHEVEVLLDEDGYPLIYRVHQEDSEWSGPEGLTIGTSLAELKKMNGKPFRLAGFGWDYGGTVTNWDDGELDHPGFLVVLGHKGVDVIFTPEDIELLMGDHEINSTLPALARYPIEVVRIEQRY